MKPVMGTRKTSKASTGTGNIKTYLLRSSQSGPEDSDLLATTEQDSTTMGDPNAKKADGASGEQKAEGVDVSPMEARIMEAIRDMKTDMNTRLDHIEGTLKENAGKIEELERSVEFSHSEIKTLTEKVQKLEADNKQLRKKSDAETQRGKSVNDALNRVEGEMREKLNDMERHSRGYSIRVKGVQDVPDREDFKVTVAKVLLG